MTSIKQDLPAPSVDGVVDGKLDPGSVPESGAMTRITNVPQDWGGSVLTLYMQEVQGPVLYQTTWPVGSHGRDINLPIPQDVLLANYGKSVQVHYSVSDFGTSRPLDIKLEQGFSGEFDFDLASHNYVVAYTHSVARPPEPIPDLARIQRVLPGATDYSSSDETIALVDRFGVVTVQRNGRVSITATGAPSGPATYHMTVKGIREFHVLSSTADWAGAERLSREAGMALPTSADFSRLKHFYRLPIGHFLDLPERPVWGEALGAGTAWIFDLNSGDSDSVDTAMLLQVVGVQPG